MNLQGSIRIPRRPSDGKGGQDGHSPYIGANGNWWEWDDSLKLYVDTGRKAEGEPGKNGLPGQIPIQKEWVVGDTHRNTDEIVDFIYVRGADKSTSYWYKLAEKGTIPDVEAPPSHGTTPSGYERIDWLKELAVKVLIAEEANLAGFIFKDNKLISQRGTVGGVAADYSGQAGFVPNLILDGTEGDVKITGTVNAKSGSIGVLTVDTSGQVKLEDPDTGNTRLSFIKSKIPLLADLLSTTNFGGSITAAGTNISIPSSGSSTSYLSGSLNVSKNASTISITGGATISLNGYSVDPDVSVDLTLYLTKNGAKYRILESLQVLGEAYTVVNTVKSTTVKGVSSGDYRLMLEVVKRGSGGASGLGNVKSIPMSWSFQQSGIRNFLFGLNGFLSFFSDRHIYFSEEEGFDLEGPTNMPGVLAKGRIMESGTRDATKAWGDKYSAGSISKPSGVGSYSVPVSCKNGDYDVNISPRTANRTFHIGVTTATYFEVFFRDQNGNVANSEFSYALVGNNY